MLCTRTPGTAYTGENIQYAVYVPKKNAEKFLQCPRNVAISMSELYVRKNMQPFLQYLLRTLFHWGENELLLNKQNRA